MQHNFRRELLAKQEAVEESRVEVRGAVREAAILKAKLQAIEGWRNHEILALRAAGRDAADNLKVFVKVGHGGVLTGDVRCRSLAPNHSGNHLDQAKRPRYCRIIPSFFFHSRV